MQPDGTPAARPRRWAAVGVLAAAAFTFVTMEVLPIGLLPQIAVGTGVSVSAAGLLVTGYAGVVVLAAVPLTLVVSRTPRRGLLLGLLTVLVLSAGASALAPTYPVLLAARVVGALAHAVFWSVVATLAARLMSEDFTAAGVSTTAGAVEGARAANTGATGRATALVFTGNSLAVVVGVPAGTWLGQVAGWRSAFAAVAALGLLLCAAAVWLLPPLPARGSSSTAALGAVSRDPAVRAAVCVTFAVVLAHFTAYTYLAPLLTTRAGFPSSAVGPLLAAFGAAGIAANLTAGGCIGRRPGAAVVAVATGITVSLTAWTLIGGHHRIAAVGVLLVWGAASAAMSVALQTLVLTVAGASADAASAAYVAAYNAGIAGGALLGGLVLARAGLHAVALTATALSILALPLAAAARAAAALHQGDGDRTGRR